MSQELLNSFSTLIRGHETGNALRHDLDAVNKMVARVFLHDHPPFCLLNTSKINPSNIFTRILIPAASISDRARSDVKQYFVQE